MQRRVNPNFCVRVGQSMVVRNIVRRTIIASNICSVDANVSKQLLHVTLISLPNPPLSDAYTGGASANPGAQ